MPDRRLQILARMSVPLTLGSLQNVPYNLADCLHRKGFFSDGSGCLLQKGLDLRARDIPYYNEHP
jgi:hypothetical protein